MTMTDRYELTIASFPQVIAYQAGGTVLGYPPPSGAPAVLAFLTVEAATDFIDVLSASGKVTGACRVVNVGIRGWLSIGDSLGVTHVAIVVGTQNGGRKIGIVPLAALLEAAKEYAAGPSEQGQDRAG